ncbi:hypothetical protein H5410_002178 [Solanum commersonii]|uniref:Uncharacterized protein n=1 Tax=Solanum commersonii TaxID=4109 RepID=A0A9J6B0Y9_SOLCO|nr:hypothetical protein H5410_002178 [Solanum commersonii]
MLFKLWSVSYSCEIHEYCTNYIFIIIRVKYHHMFAPHPTTPQHVSLQHAILCSPVYASRNFLQENSKLTPHVSSPNFIHCSFVFASNICYQEIQHQLKFNPTMCEFTKIRWYDFLVDIVVES